VLLKWLLEECKMITQRFRQNYTGEFIITNTAWSGGKKRTQREWIANPIENHHISGRAACIGSCHTDTFDFKILPKHKGGLLGTKKLQTYGTGEIAKSTRLDFVVERDEKVIKELIDQGYYKNNIIYTSPRVCLAHPGVFYTIPYNPPVIKQVALVYLAAFDGHREIFLLGYHSDAELGHSDWDLQMEKVIAAYPDTKFYHVAHGPQTPDRWKNYSNLVQLTHREFITYADI
jgi:hypothetical protein